MIALTREELRKVFADAEERVFNPQTAALILAELKDSSKLKAVDERDLACRVHRILDRELVFEVLARILVDK